jgi:geranylgeranyl diphosphate synthase type II
MTASVDKFVERVNCRLETLLSGRRFDALGVKADNPLVEGYLYAVKDGGKRIRPISVYFGALATGKTITEKDFDALVDLASVVELVHSYSLVHDDLPAMDNDDYRRGKPSTHKKYGEANGILIGDGLLTIAMMTALNLKHGEDYIAGAKMIADGALNMVSGQVYDLAEGCKNYEVIYNLKTAELIANSFRAGARCMGAEESVIYDAGQFGHHLGMAFQLADDLLDDGLETSLVTEKGRGPVEKQLQEETMKAMCVAKGLANSEVLTDFATKLFKRTK